MTRTRLDYSLLTDRARLANRPADAEGLRIAALDLACSGLREADIAQCLGVGVNAVRALLAEREARS